MTRIEKYERAIEERAANLQEYGISSAAFWAYRKSQEAENEMIDFSECLWDRDIEGICNDFKEFGIERFTISSTYSGLISTLTIFEANGYKVAGLTKVTANYIDFLTQEKAIVPAIVLVKA